MVPTIASSAANTCEKKQVQWPESISFNYRDSLVDYESKYGFKNITPKKVSINNLKGTSLYNCYKTDYSKKDNKGRKTSTGNYKKSSGNSLVKHGIVWEEYDSGHKFYGEFREGKRTGFGIYLYEYDEFHIGEWKNNKRHGEGEYYGTIDGDIFRIAGNWKNGKRDGAMVYTQLTGDYIGYSYTYTYKSDGTSTFTKINGKTKTQISADRIKKNAEEEAKAAERELEWEAEQKRKDNYNQLYDQCIVKEYSKILKNDQLPKSLERAIENRCERYADDNADKPLKSWWQ